MNRQIRGLGILVIALFLAIFVQLNVLQVMRASDLNRHPGNTRAVVRDFSEPRGSILSADGAVLAESVPTGDAFKRLRRYPEGSTFAHITGYFSLNYGSEGIEQQYAKELAGRTPKLELKRLSDILLDKKRTADVILTVSKRLQAIATFALRGRRGAVVAIDPKTGAILAMVDAPTYDPNPLSSHDGKTVSAAWNTYLKDPAKPLLPRAYREAYFPGSTFKVVTSAIALQNGVTPDQPVYPRLTRIPLPNTNNQFLANFGGESCGGPLKEGLRVSCNTTFAQIGLDLGGAKLSAGADAFGFNHRPPLDLPAVAKSSFPPEQAFLRDKPAVAKSAIGQQDVSATPLEMALVASAVANNGVIMTPHLMAQIRDSEGQVIDTYQPKPWLTAMPPTTAQTLRDLMINVVEAGTGTSARIPGIQVAGKTGTAQTGRGTIHAWFVSFAPAADPKIAVAVIIEDQPGTNDSTGGAIAAPIARAVMQAALQP
ncbi:MAG: cell division protein FtsI/penicillin-binding protein 2 [Acidimicrobiales bacterium]|nr:cell division protein FtsI/penicillin-binding protein 2 [Acidimicrobiales bacterium]